MAGRGPTPKANRRNKADIPIRGDWRPAPGVGWQHGDPPPAPSGLLKASREAWEIWFAAWYAAYWKPEDLPALRQVIRLYDQVERGEFQRHGELRLAFDTWGISPKGQQDRRWIRPLDRPLEPAVEAPEETTAETAEVYGHLRVVPGA